MNQKLFINRDCIVKYFPYFLFCYHLVFSRFAFLFAQEIGGDSLNYWFEGKNLENLSWLELVHPGTIVINMLTFPLVKYLHLPFWSGFLLFSLVSFIGIYKLWKLIVTCTQHNKVAFAIGIMLMLLPNIHVWTSFIGKESILFVALIIMIEKIMAKNLKSLSFILAFSLIAIIRPHVAVILFVSLLIALFWKGDLTRKMKWYLLGISTLASIPLYFVLKKIARIKDNPWERILHIYDYHIRDMKATNSYVSLDEYYLPYKIFTFYYRPLPFEKTGLLYQIWSLENFILLLLSLITLLVVIKYRKIIKWNFFQIFAIFVLLLLSVMYVYAYANYGLIARTKIMAMPFLYIFILQIWIQLKANFHARTYFKM